MVAFLSSAPPSLFRLSTLMLLVLLVLPSAQVIVEAQVDQCEAGDETCQSNSQQQQQQQQPTKFSVEFINESQFRADIYWDDGGYGSNIAIVEQNGGTTNVNTFVGHSFFITRHGVREGLHNPKTDEQYRFTVSKPGEVFVIPQSAAPSTEPCQDRFSICKKEAELGKCSWSPGWMIVHCCKSCDEELGAARLIDPNVRCTRENLNVTTPAWKPGDLNTLFTSWATDAKFAQYEPQVLSSPGGAHGGKSGPWVITFDNFLTDAEADALVKGGEMMGFERSTDQGEMNALGEQVKVVSQSRTSSNAWCTGQCERLPEVISVTNKIEQVTGIPKKNYESFQILDYERNQFYRRHHDSSPRDTTPSGPRIMTFFLYLSDVEEGGETAFTELDLAVKPKKGRALVWPSVTDDDPEFWDSRMYHEAKGVIKGEKYAANHWIHLYDYMGPNHWGCTGSFS